MLSKTNSILTSTAKSKASSHANIIILNGRNIFHIYSVSMYISNWADTKITVLFRIITKENLNPRQQIVYHRQALTNPQRNPFTFCYNWYDFFRFLAKRWPNLSFIFLFCSGQGETHHFTFRLGQIKIFHKFLLKKIRRITRQ